MNDQAKPSQAKPSQAKPSQAHSCIPYDLFQVTAPVNKQNRDEKSPCHTLAKDNCAHAAVVVGCMPINADADRSNSAALTPSPDAEGRIRLRDPGSGIGEDGDPMFTMQSTKPHAVAIDLQNVAIGGDIAGTLDTTRLSRGGGQAVAFKPGQSEAAGGTFVTEGFAPTLQSQNNGSTAVPAVAFKPSHFTRGKDGSPSEIVAPLSADADKGDQDTIVAFSPLQGGRSMPVTPESPTLEAGTGNKTPAVAHPSVVAFAQNTLGEVRVNADVMGTVNQNQNASGRNTPMVAFGGGCQHHHSDALYTKGYTGAQRDACQQEAYAGSVLQLLRQEVGEKDFAKWGLGILDSLQGEEVLRSSVLGQGNGSSQEVANPEAGCEVVSGPSQGKKHLPKGRVSKVRKAGRERRASQGWKLSEQLARELGAYLQELSQQGAPAEAVMRDLWQASDGLRVLRDALPEVQEVGRSASCEGQSVHGGSQGYGSEQEKEVRGSGLRSVGACEGSLRSSLDAEEAWNARQAAEDKERNSKRNVGQTPLCVRRLVPRECEILQGFPPDYTAIPYRNKLAADGPRYRALGNSMAVPCMWWLGLRIHKATS